MGCSIGGLRVNPPQHRFRLEVFVHGITDTKHDTLCNLQGDTSLERQQNTAEADQAASRDLEAAASCKGVALRLLSYPLLTLRPAAGQLRSAPVVTHTVTQTDADESVGSESMLLFAAGKACSFVAHPQDLERALQLAPLHIMYVDLPRHGPPSIQGAASLTLAVQGLDEACGDIRYNSINTVALYDATGSPAGHISLAVRIVDLGLQVSNEPAASKDIQLAWPRIPHSSGQTVSVQTELPLSTSCDLTTHQAPCCQPSTMHECSAEGKTDRRPKQSAQPPPVQPSLPAIGSQYDPYTHKQPPLVIIQMPHADGQFCSQHGWQQIAAGYPPRAIAQCWHDMDSQCQQAAALDLQMQRPQGSPARSQPGSPSRGLAHRLEVIGRSRVARHKPPSPQLKAMLRSATAQHAMFCPGCLLPFANLAPMRQLLASRPSTTDMHSAGMHMRTACPAGGHPPAISQSLDQQPQPAPQKADSVPSIPRIQPLGDTLCAHCTASHAAQSTSPGVPEHAVENEAPGACKQATPECQPHAACSNRQPAEAVLQQVDSNRDDVRCAQGQHIASPKRTALAHKQWRLSYRGGPAGRHQQLRTCTPAGQRQVHVQQPAHARGHQDSAVKRPAGMPKRVSKQQAPCHARHESVSAEASVADGMLWPPGAASDFDLIELLAQELEHAERMKAAASKARLPEAPGGQDGKVSWRQPGAGAQKPASSRQRNSHSTAVAHKHQIGARHTKPARPLGPTVAARNQAASVAQHSVHQEAEASKAEASLSAGTGADDDSEGLIAAATGCVRKQTVQHGQDNEAVAKVVTAAKQLQQAQGLSAYAAVAAQVRQRPALQPGATSGSADADQAQSGQPATGGPQLGCPPAENDPQQQDSLPAAPNIPAVKDVAGRAGSSSDIIANEVLAHTPRTLIAIAVELDAQNLPWPPHLSEQLAAAQALLRAADVHHSQDHTAKAEPIRTSNAHAVRDQAAGAAGTGMEQPAVAKQLWSGNSAGSLEGDSLPIALSKGTLRSNASVASGLEGLMLYQSCSSSSSQAAPSSPGSSVTQQQMVQQPDVDERAAAWLQSSIDGHHEASSKPDGADAGSEYGARTAQWVQAHNEVSRSHGEPAAPADATGAAMHPTSPPSDGRKLPMPAMQQSPSLLLPAVRASARAVKLPPLVMTHQLPDPDHPHKQPGPESPQHPDNIKSLSREPAAVPDALVQRTADERTSGRQMQQAANTANGPQSEQHDSQALHHGLDQQHKQHAQREQAAALRPSPPFAAAARTSASAASSPARSAAVNVSMEAESVAEWHPSPDRLSSGLASAYVEAAAGQGAQEAGPARSPSGADSRPYSPAFELDSDDSGDDQEAEVSHYIPSFPGHAAQVFQTTKTVTSVAHVPGAIRAVRRPYRRSQ